MSYGTIITNNSGELAITDSTANYHYTGSFTAYTTFTGSTGYNNLTTMAYYNVSAPNKPLIFAEPTGTNRFMVYAVTNTGTGTWRVLVLYTGTPPKIHSFSTLSATTPGENTGLLIYRSNGTIAFDSTRGPLALHTQTSFGGSAAPTSGGQNTELNDSSINLGTLPTRAAFFYQTRGFTNYTFNNLSTVYNAFHALAYRNGNSFGKIWRKTNNFGLAPGSITFQQFSDNSARPLFVIDAAKYD
jgi:hypothetical protein